MMLNDPFLRRLALAVVILIVALAIWSATLQTSAQGGYTVTDQMPAPGMVAMDTRFWFIIQNAGVTEEWLMNVAGFIVWSDPTRPPEYMILRIDNMIPVDDLIDPLDPHSQYKPGIVPNWIPTDQLPLPTWFIWGDATLRVYLIDSANMPLE